MCWVRGVFKGRGDSPMGVNGVFEPRVTIRQTQAEVVPGSLVEQQFLQRLTPNCMIRITGFQAHGSVSPKVVLSVEKTLVTQPAQEALLDWLPKLVPASVAFVLSRLLER